jgi:predicted permease
VLARSQYIAALHEHAPMPARDFVPVVFVKLVVHPLLVWALGRGAMLLGLPLRPESLTVMVLVAALPSASNVALLAERFAADTGRIARIILLTTAAAFITFSAAVAVMK